MRILETIAIDTQGNFNGLFHHILASNTFTWLTSENASVLDNMYYFMHSGDKSTSPYYDRMFEIFHTNELTNQNIAPKIIEMFKDKWNKTYEALTAQYNPIQDINVTETRTPNIKKTRSQTVAQNSDVTTQTDDQTSVYGFNSSDAVPSDKNNGTRRVTANADNNHIDTDIEDNETGNEIKTKSGLTGDRTTQDMINKELELRKTKFYSIIFKDIDSVITLRIYND